MTLRFAVLSLALLALPLTVHSQDETAPDILAQIQASNDAEIKAGELASKKASNPDVKGFADMMVKHHQESNKKIEKSDVDVDEGPATEQSKDATKKAYEHLQALPKGGSFDKAYMDHQVEAHTRLLTAIDSALKDRASLGKDATSLVESTRGVVKGHLEKAKKIRSKLKK